MDDTRPSVAGAVVVPTLGPETQGAPTDPTRAYLASLSPAGREAMTKRLRAVARLLPASGGATPAWEEVPWHALRFQHVETIRQRLIERGAAPATVNLTLAALRGIARYARNLGLLTAEEYDRIRDVRPARGTRLPAGRAAARGELLALVGACAADPTLAGARDAALLAVLYVGGVRRSELVGLDLADWTPDPPTLRVRHGKGDKERLVPLAGGAAAAVAAWVRRRGDVPGALFLPINKAGKGHGARLSDGAIYKILQKRLDQAGVAPLSPHDFRRTFVGDLLDAGIDLATVQRLAGHASPTTTARYDRRGEVAKRKAVEVLHFPFGER